MATSKFNVGDLIIDSNQVHTIVKIEDDKIFYQSLNQSSSRHDCLNSIPLTNLSMARIRPLLTPQEVKDFLKKISTEEEIDSPKINNNRINSSNFFKDIIYLNDPQKTAKLLIHLLKIKNETKLSYVDQSIFDQGLAHLAEEISVVSNISVSTATAKILAAIKR